MKQLLYLLIWFPFSCSLSVDPEINTWKEQASRVTIVRDKWGVAHVYGKTDADAVFGLMYAQCEENFERVERAYIQKFGRLSEIEGEGWLYEDLKTRLLYDSAAATKDYNNSPVWLKKLLDAFAGGINYYLYKNPSVKPQVFHRFEPWFPLMFTDGAYISVQTGGLTARDLKEIYPLPGNRAYHFLHEQGDMTGSNAFAIAPSKSESQKSLLYINPHVSFYFRTEMHMSSEEGLNAYGAVTWGNFFVYQGFNEYCGWMHTSSLADGADLYYENAIEKDNKWVYRIGESWHPAQKRSITLHYKKNDKLHSINFNTYKTRNGPVVGKRNGNWLALKENNRSMDGLIQSWQRMKARNLDEFKKVLDIRANGSTNTMYADREGNIAYWHGNRVPRRNNNFNWSQPVNGYDTTTAWDGLHTIDELIHFINPPGGWLQNCNSSPFTAVGNSSLSAAAFPSYMAPDGENFRSLYAIKQLQSLSAITMDKLIDLGYSHYLSAFDSLLPSLFTAYDQLAKEDPLSSALQHPVSLLKSWDKNSGTSSIATTLAILWAYNLVNYGTENLNIEDSENSVVVLTAYAKKTPAHTRLQLLDDMVKALERAYGTWQVPWGELNRYQRTSGDFYQQFDDDKPSLPVGLASALFGSLPSYETEWSNTRKAYGIAGNSFVAVVEFGEKVRAKSIITGGQSFDPQSKNFNDQANMFLEGKFKDVLFYKQDVINSAVRTYVPGD